MVSLGGSGPGVNPDGTIPRHIADPLGSLDQTSQLANSFGFAGQAVNKDYIAGYKNQFLIGASYDRGNVGYGATSTLGSFDPQVRRQQPRRSADWRRARCRRAT